MIERIIEIAETAAYLSLENDLLKIRLPDGKSTTVPVAEYPKKKNGNTAVSGNTCWGKVLFKCSILFMQNIVLQEKILKNTSGISRI